MYTRSLHPYTFTQLHACGQTTQGWHLELDTPEEPLTFKGVVFNEMKGVYSSPDSMFYR